MGTTKTVPVHSYVASAACLTAWQANFYFTCLPIVSTAELIYTWSLGATLHALGCHSRCGHDGCSTDLGDFRLAEDDGTLLLLTLGI